MASCNKTSYPSPMLKAMRTVIPPTRPHAQSHVDCYPPTRPRAQSHVDCYPKHTCTSVKKSYIKASKRDCAEFLVDFAKKVAS